MGSITDEINPKVLRGFKINLVKENEVAQMNSNELFLYGETSTQPDKAIKSSFEVDNTVSRHDATNKYENEFQKGL